MARLFPLLFALATVQEAKTDRLVAAYYHLEIAALKDHPAVEGEEPLARHRRELGEMARAAVDIALVIVRQRCAPEDLVKALEDLEREDKLRPLLAPCLDAAALRVGTAELAAAVRSFMGAVPARFRASIDGRPVVALLPLLGDNKRAFGLLPLLADELKKDFDGRAPWWIADPGWGEEAPATVRGFEGVREYERQWTVAQRLGARLVVIRSWNGFQEGSEACESREHGRSRLDSTLRFARRFKMNERPTVPKGKWTGARRIFWSLKYNPNDQGLRPVAAEDGLFDTAEFAGLKLLTTKENRGGAWRHLYFDVDDTFALAESRSVEVTVEFLDAGKGCFALQYDSADAQLQGDGRFVKSAGEVPFEGTGELRTVSFHLADAYFGNAQRGGADFRIAVEKRGIAVRAVQVAPR
jgi:hypothetical protein